MFLGTANPELAAGFVLSRMGLPSYPRLQEKCGLSAVIIDPSKAKKLGFMPGSAASIALQFGINLQNRGADSAGYSIQPHGTNEISGQCWPGKVHEIHPDAIPKVASYSAVVHNRWPITGAASDPCSMQPICAKATINGKEISFSVSHNGNLTNHFQIAHYLSQHGASWQGESDTCVIPPLCIIESNKKSFTTAADLVHHISGCLQGSYNLLFHFPDCIVSAVDPHSNRPLFFATDIRSDCAAYFIFSETSAAHAIATSDFNENNLICAAIPRGSIITFKAGTPPLFHTGSSSMPDFAASCLFEPAYIQNADGALNKHVKLEATPTNFHGTQMYPLKDFTSVFEFRRQIGKSLAREYCANLANTNYVAHIPDSGYPFALGIADQLEKPMLNLLIRRERTEAINRTRSYMVAGIKHQILSSGQKYELDIDLINSLGPHALQGTKLVFSDDSVVRGTTLNTLAPFFKRLRSEFGVAEIDLLVGFPNVKFGCPYGTLIEVNRLWAPQFGHLGSADLHEKYGLDRISFTSIEQYSAVATSFGLEGCDECVTGRAVISGWDKVNRSKTLHS